ncbi:ABC transporter permease [Acetobacter fabarum]|uniref:ABC transporter permease n=4 Tax=Acetobacter fabarum TaxID=483199 RepID=A0A269XWP7_9PROT|nr:ABC transporter permease [Acetobacter fabarum]MCI1243456.1 ABC transporter permease [Acetobacter fabarum]MCI1909503.1 ABC transporter permease [Acetobacter fabarum]MCI1927481.1 ABC transporter permease [Acetobacter fabarum]MCI1947481.1 ABC transporter permease [Acetobacter fabarum]MCI1988266.1 ABC transporter permease [Acetobacter fabarum]
MTQQTDPSPPTATAEPAARPAWSLQTGPHGPCLSVRGAWTVPNGGVLPFTAADIPPPPPGTTSLSMDTAGITAWDSSFISFLWEAKQAAASAGLAFEQDGLPAPAQRLLALLPPNPAPPARHDSHKQNLLEKTGDLTLGTLNETGVVASLALDTTRGAMHALHGKSRMRTKDLITDLWNAGPNALLIVGVVNFLIGAILAFVGLVELRRFAAEIYVTNLVGIACAREISAIMTAIIMAGRTGGAYAARIATMLGNEEIDALQVFGIPISGYILLPAILSLSLMMPLLYLYGTLIGILGGFVVSMSMMDVSPVGYWISTVNGVELKEFVFGFIKAFFFGSFIALAACRVGLKAGRSAADVGIAATRAVVIGIVGIIAMDAVFAVMANALGI